MARSNNDGRKNITNYNRKAQLNAYY